MGRTLTNVDLALRRCWHPIARPAEVTDQPTQFFLLGEPWVLYRAGGRIVAFEDRCPHRRSPLSLGECQNDILQCAYHGWRFDAYGKCIDIPALGPGATVPPAAILSPPAGLVEAHGMVFLAPEEPIAPLGSIPEADDATFLAGELPTMETRGSAGLLADNFLDVAHFPFVHSGTFGADEAAEVPQYTVARDDWTFTMSYEHSFANREDPAVAAGTRPLVQTRRLEYRLSAPFHLRLRIDFVEAGGSNVIGFFIQPQTADTCRLFTTLWRDDLDYDEQRMAAAIDFEVEVLEEDLKIQSAFHDLVLPLAPTDEVHTRADRTTLELRRVLSDLVAACRDADADDEPLYLV
jgi:phenylpropionate dioxygenase-like ring-hydroxylating dioxygenase large terminal subunit